MLSSRSSSFVRAAFLPFLVVFAVAAGTSAAQAPTLVSVDVTGSAAGDNRSFSPAIDASGRYVAFVSAAQDLVVPPPPGSGTAYRRDLVSGETLVVGVNDSPYDVGLLSDIGISDDGNRIVYRRGSGLGPFSQPDVFVRDVAAAS